MSKITVEATNLVAVADKIREKGGTSAALNFPDGFIAAVADIKTGITPTGNKQITANGTHDVTNFANAIVSVSDSQHFAYGYKTMTANSTFEIKGITDQQGKTFTPKGYIFTLLPSTSSEYTGGSSSPALVACVYDTVNKRMTRTRTADTAWKTFCNVSVSSGSVGSGTFKQTASSDKKYNCFGAEYFWIAWG